MKLTATQRLMLRCSAAGAQRGVGSTVRLTGAGNYRTAFTLEKLGLGEVSGNRFAANSAGLDAVSPKITGNQPA